MYFHCAKAGHKLDALASDDKVSFCVMDEGFRKSGDWALNIKSIVIFGCVKKIDAAQETVEIVRQIGLKYYPTAEGVEEEIRKAVAQVQILELSIDHMTGKLVNES
ncbi:MAG: pyridoxamine 5'-phosphate oxidase family protein [Anaerotignum sp.]|nr:pyridoxamine 5'-phosphate oxidase family protein [Anaerotignum sp.]